MKSRKTYTAVDIVGLCLLEELAILLAVDHPPIHGYGVGHDLFDEAFLARMTHGIDASFGEREVDGFGEVEGDGGGIADVWEVYELYFGD